MHTYEALMESVKDISRLKSAMAVLEWDEETYMPPNGASSRGEQIAALAVAVHEKLCRPELGNWIAECRGDSTLNEDKQRMVSEIERDRNLEIQVPAPLVKKLSLTVTRAFQAWAEAKRKSDFSIYAPVLQELLSLSLEKAKALQNRTHENPYDVFLDIHETDLRLRALKPVVESVREISRKALNAIMNSAKKPDASILTRDYPEEKQETLAWSVIRALGFDMNSGRIDRSEHPFSTGFSSRDVRLTTRYDRNFLQMSLYGAIHECGHGLYEQGLNPEFEGTPFGEAASLAIHESQSRFWENIIGRSLPFCHFIFPQLQTLFPEALSHETPESFCFAVNEVKPSLIRTEADEVSYNLHVALRFDIEQMLFSGELKVHDLPAFWNGRMQSDLGILPPDDRDGVLQDVHWAHGSFGYFPTYLLGNLYAANWNAELRKNLPGTDREIEKGNFQPILNWLRENIHRHGRRYNAGELIARISGHGLDTQVFETYLKGRFGPLYGVDW